MSELILQLKTKPSKIINAAQRNVGESCRSEDANQLTLGWCAILSFSSNSAANCALILVWFATRSNLWAMFSSLFVLSVSLSFIVPPPMQGRYARADLAVHAR